MRPPTALGRMRLIQSARLTSPTENEVLDPSVWTRQALERPPSRQKPPPEALHLFSSDDTAWRVRCCTAVFT